MTEERMALLELIEKGADADLVRELLASASERLMMAEIDQLTGAAAEARSPDRVNHRRYHDVPCGQVAALGGKHGAGAGCRRGGPDGDRAEQGELVAGGA